MYANQPRPSSFAAPARVPRGRLVPLSGAVRKARRRTRRIVYTLLVACGLYVGAYASVVHLEVGLNRWQKEIRVIKEHNAFLRANLARVQSAFALDSQATQRLGMGPPQAIEYVTIPRGEIIARDAPHPSPPAPVPSLRPGY
jgi:hypothetical protein